MAWLCGVDQGWWWVLALHQGIRSGFPVSVASCAAWGIRQNSSWHLGSQNSKQLPRHGLVVLVWRQSLRACPKSDALHWVTDILGVSRAFSDQTEPARAAAQPLPSNHRCWMVGLGN